jgi:purine nucleoside permease
MGGVYKELAVHASPKKEAVRCPNIVLVDVLAGTKVYHGTEQVHDCSDSSSTVHACDGDVCTKDSELLVDCCP